ncbi:acyl carrier protein [Actinophytocola sediminis]
MSQDERTESAPVSTDTVEDEIAGFVADQTGTRPELGQDLFAAGLANSMFAMKLVVFLETTYSVTVGGTDLRLVNFRTVLSMAALVDRLRVEAAASGDV